MTILLGFASVASAIPQSHPMSTPLTKTVTNADGHTFDLTVTITNYSSEFTGFDFEVTSGYAVHLTLFKSNGGTKSPVDNTPLGNLTPDCVEGLNYTLNSADGDYTAVFTASGCGAHDLSGTPNCTTAVTCSKCYYEGDPDDTKHAYGNWVSNGDGTHTRTCANDATHTETDTCTGGTATCQNAAICKDCSTAYGTVNEDKHPAASIVSTPAVPATETADGWTEGTQCSACQKVILERTRIPAHAHKGICTENTTCTVTNCGANIPKDPNNHTTLTPIPAVEPTTTETGLTEGQYCTACGVITLEQQVVPMLPTDDIPETSDGLEIFLFAGLAAVSALGMMTLRKRENN